MATGLIEVDAAARVAWVNAAGAQLLAAGVRSVVGQPVHAVLRAPSCAAAVQRVLAEGDTVQLREVRLPSGSDELRADITLQPFAGGVLLEVHALAAATGEAAPLSASLRGLAHEMKNPLAGMRGAAQLLERRATDDTARALGALIIGEVDRLTALANRLLHHDGAPHLALVNIHAVIERALEVLRLEPALPALREDYDPSVPELLVDAGRLQQVLLNLLRNAVQAGAAAVTVRTRVEYGARVVDRVCRSALRVDVQDDGPGLPEAVRGQLFQPLVSARTDGAGLGLALSRELAREHGGDLRCVSRPGATVFSLYLPLERSHA